MNVRDQLTKIIADEVGIDPSNIQEEQSLTSLGVVGFSSVVVWIEIETQFHFELADETWDAMKTFGDLVKGVTTKMVEVA